MILPKIRDEERPEDFQVTEDSRYQTQRKTKRGGVNPPFYLNSKFK